MTTESKVLKVGLAKKFHKVWNVKKVSNHPNDDHLRIALVEVKREIVGNSINQEFATYLFNGDLDNYNGGFVSGHYFDSFTDAMADYQGRN